MSNSPGPGGPPQLHLALPSNTTSFKRSFEQFGFDLESPVGGPEAGSSGSGSSRQSGNGRHSRNKRARSASSLSEGDDSLRSSVSSATFTSGSSETSISEGSSDGPSGVTAVSSAVSPPRIPTPDIQDIEMPDYQQEDAQLQPSEASFPVSDEDYRLSLEELSSLESLHRPSTILRSPSPPPTLPPLVLEESTSSIPFLDSTAQPMPVIPGSLYPARRAPDVPPRLPSPVQRSSSTLSSSTLSEPLFVSESFDSANSGTTIETPPSSALLDAVEPRNDADAVSRRERDLSFTERLNAALDTGDITSFRERVNSALDAFRDSSNRAYDDVGESSSLSTARPRSNASTVSNRRGTARSLTTLSVAIPGSSILSSDFPSPSLDPLLSNSVPSDTTPTTTMPQPQRTRNPSLAIRELLDDSAPETNTPSMPLSPPSRLSPIQFSDPLWDSGDSEPVTGTPVASSSTASGGRPPLWRQIQQIDNSIEQRRRSLQRGLRRQSSFSRDLTRWFEDSSSNTDAATSSSTTGPPRLDFGDTWEGGEDEPPIAPRPAIPLSDIYFYPEIATGSSRTNDATRNAGHFAFSSEDRDRDEASRQARRARLMLDNRERETMNHSMRSSLTERRTHDLDTGVDLERSRTQWSRRVPGAFPQSSWGFIPYTEYSDPFTIQDGTETRQSSSDVWQFSWNDAFRARERQRQRERERRNHELRLDIESQLNGWDSMDVDRDESARDDTDSGPEISDSERNYRQSRRMRTRPGSSLFDSGDSDWRSASRAFTSDLGQASSLSSSFTPGVRRNRSRISGPRPGASNSLLTENAAELRRRTARAELMEQYSSHSHASATSDADRASQSGIIPRRLNAIHHDITRSLYDRHDSDSPVLPPLPYQYRSRSPPALPQAIVEILDSVDRETQHQERLNDDEHRRPSTRLHSRHYNSSLYEREREPQRDSDMDIDRGATSFQRVAEERLRRIEMALQANSDSREQLSRSHNHSPSWSFPNESRSTSRQESSGFFDSQSSTISDIIRTITSNGDLDLPEYEAQRREGDESERVPLLSSHEDRNRWSSSSDLPDQTSSLARHLRSRSNPPPSIPPPDFGDTSMFIPDNFSPEVASPESAVPERRADFSSNAPSRIPRPSAHHHSSSGSSSNPVTDARAPPARGVIDVDAFAPGPFRTTMQRMVDHGRLRSTRQQAQIPPVIPPFTFDDDFEPLGPDLSTLRASDIAETRILRPGHTHRTIPTSTTSSPNTYREARENPFSLNRRISLPAPRSLSPFPRSFAEEQNRQRPDDLHRVIRNHARMDASLLHGPDLPSSRSQSSSAPGESEGFNHAIEVLRHDGLSEARSQQLIDRYRRERSANAPSPSSTSSLWGALEESSNTSNTSRAWRASRGSTPGSLANPFSASLADYMRTRDSRQPSPTRPSDRLEARLEATQERLRAARTFLGFRNRNPVSFGDDLFNEMLLPPRRTRPGAFSFGDFVRDEDFDNSYESLSLLDARLGEVKPRGTPDHIVAGLDTAFFKDWMTEDCDKRCPICLDDYKSLDPVLKLKECLHWLHKSCLEQWLKGASTCPVCRKSVMASPSPSPPFSFSMASSSSSSAHPRPLPDHVRWNFRFRRAARRPSEPGNSDGVNPTEADPSRSRTNSSEFSGNSHTHHGRFIPTYGNSPSSTSTSVSAGPRPGTSSIAGLGPVAYMRAVANSNGYSRRRRSAGEANNSAGDHEPPQQGSGSGSRAGSGSEANDNGRNQDEDDTSRAPWHRYMP
ncbi:hypothetical protein D9758_003709 [Tetrapyrgos nigripes]|uniref:RING-type domain-containing protein n=1 Tax=Tetrapyrgos nigripes TaxID=182062 RepID=A0A8H5LS83_9AGAR|nr:hypothetical protein D9758_003709 [Tetrapyrgos nigripes]